MTRLRLAPDTARNQTRWTVAAVLFATIAAMTPVMSGGSDPWFRWIAGALTVGGTVGACRFRNTLHVPMLSAVSAAALLPNDVTIAPAVVAGVSGVALLLSAESVAVARRLTTGARVRTTMPDVRALASLGAASTFAVLAVALLAQLDRFGSRFFAVGLPVAAFALALAVSGTWRRGMTR